MKERETEVDLIMMVIFTNENLNRKKRIFLESKKKKDILADVIYFHGFLLIGLMDFRNLFEIFLTIRYHKFVEVIFLVAFIEHIFHYIKKKPLNTKKNQCNFNLLMNIELLKLKLGLLYNSVEIDEG